MFVNTEHREGAAVPRLSKGDCRGFMQVRNKESVIATHAGGDATVEDRDTCRGVLGKGVCGFRCGSVFHLGTRARRRAESPHR